MIVIRRILRCNIKLSREKEKKGKANHSHKIIPHMIICMNGGYIHVYLVNEKNKRKFSSHPLTLAHTHTPGVSHTHLISLHTRLFIFYQFHQLIYIYIYINKTPNISPYPQLPKCPSPSLPFYSSSYPW